MKLEKKEYIRWLKRENNRKHRHGKIRNRQKEEKREKIEKGWVFWKWKKRRKSLQEKSKDLKSKTEEKSSQRCVEGASSFMAC